jgi:glycosyltransferase involved in cell wall biosynthesis
LDTDLVVVPHAFDTKVWSRPIEEELTSESWDKRESEPDGYAFYTIASPIERKNLVGLLAAYYRAFHGKDVKGLRLGIKSNVQRNIIKQIEDAAVEVSGCFGCLPQVRWFRDRWPTSILRDFHLSCDCWVSATRGEGFDLGLAEAMLCGNRVITTDWGASKELVVGSCRDGLLVSSQLVQVPTSMAMYGPYSENQKWADPDIDSLAAVMVEAYEERATRARDPKQWETLAPSLCLRTVGEKLAAVLRGQS